MPLLRLLPFHHLLRLTTLFVSYFLPTLDCIKSILHNDQSKVRFLIIHFVVLHVTYLLFTPLFQSGAVNSLLELPLIFWLSSSHTRGSLVIYECILLPLLDRFEGHVDDEIEKRSREMRAGAVRFMLNGGAAFIGQIWEVLTNTGDADNGDINGAGASVSGDNISSDAAATAAGPLDPQHSVRGSLLSIQSNSGSQDTADGDHDGNMAIDDDETYVRDFLVMLERGLYVFAHVSANDTSDMSTISTADDDETSACDKTFSLRIFSFDSATKEFRLSSVDSHHHAQDAMTLPVLEIDEVSESGAQGITLILRVGLEAEVKEVEIVLSDDGDRDTLLYGLQVCIAHLVGDGRDN